jgi:hypothetical protein
MSFRNEVTLYAYKNALQEVESVGVTAVDNGDGTISLLTNVADISGAEPIAVTTQPDNPVGTTISDTGSIDAFARSRISEPFTLFDSKQIWNDPDFADSVENFPLFWDNQEISGAGTATAFDVDRASTTLSVSLNTAGVRVRQTRQRFNYQPGKSQLVILTGVVGATSAGNTKRLGYYDDDNGLFYQDNGGTWSVVVRSSVSGAAVDIGIAQADWNLDTMDGNGPSGVTLDPLAAQILFFDLEWLGVGRVRFGFFVDGLPIYVHELLNSNNLTSVYMSTPNLPIRAEIINDGTGAADSIEQICSTVISEGGSQPNGVFRSANLGTLAASEIQATAIGTTYAVCGIKLKSAYLSANVRETGISMIETVGNNSFLWQLHINPTLTTGLTYSDVPESAVEFGVGLAAGDVITDDGLVIDSDYVSRDLSSVNAILGSAWRLGAAIDDTPDELILSVTPITANQDILGGMTWREAW